MYEFNLVIYGNYVYKPYYKIYNAKSDENRKSFQEEHFSCSSENQLKFQVFLIEKLIQM